MFTKYDIRMLADDNRIFQREGIRKLARLGFTKEHKKAARIIEQVALSEEQFGELLLFIYESPAEMEDDVRQWMDDNPELVKAWSKTGWF